MSDRSFSDAHNHLVNTHARVLDRMECAGIPIHEAREMLDELSEAESALRSAFTLHSQRAAFRASLTKSPQEA